MKLRSDIKNEKRNNLLMILFAVAFLVIAFKVTGQTLDVSRQSSYDNYLNKQVTSIFPTDPLLFASPVNKKDTIFLSIVADSVSVNAYKIKLYVFFPRNVDIKKTKSITLGFADKSTATFGVYKTDEKQGYVEYFLSEQSYKKLLRTKFEYVVFDNIAQCYVKNEQDYFVGFFNSYCKN